MREEAAARSRREAEAERERRRKETEKAERAEKERIEAEKRAEEERAQKVLHDAAAKIQALFRGVQCRKEQAKGAGKKGKKGKVRFTISSTVTTSMLRMPSVIRRLSSRHIAILDVCCCC